MESSVGQIDTLVQPASRLHLFSVTALGLVWVSVGLQSTFSCLCIFISSPLILKGVEGDKTKSRACLDLKFWHRIVIMAKEQIGKYEAILILRKA